MSPLNHLFNHVSDMTKSDSFFRSCIASRAMTLFGGLPLEFCAMAQNLIKLPWLSIAPVLKIPIKLINICLDFQILKELISALPGVKELLMTTFKVAGYVLGAIFTTIVGFVLSPYFNFRLHVLMGLISDEKAKKAHDEAEQKAKKQREVQEKAMQTHYYNLILAMKRKISEKQRQLVGEREQIEKERELVEERKKDVEITASTSPNWITDLTIYQNLGVI